MAKYFTLFFTRSSAEGTACIQYALIPQGKRFTIRIPEGNVSNYFTTESEDITLVNVFALQSNGVGLPPGKMWQFPAPLEPPIHLVGATVHVDEGAAGPPSPNPSEGGTAYGVGFYDDGRSGRDKVKLFPGTPDCEDPAEPVRPKG